MAGRSFDAEKRVVTLNQIIRAGELLDQKAESADKALERLQNGTREANSTLAAMTARRKELEALEHRLKALVDEQCGSIISEKLKEMSEHINETSQFAVEKNSKRVIAVFDELKDILMGEERGDDRMTVPEMVTYFDKVLDIKWPLLLKAVSAAKAVSDGCASQTDGKFCKKEATWAILAKVDIGDGNSGEMHTHVCNEHARELRADKTVTVLKSFELENKICPWVHEFPTRFELDEED